MPNRLITRRRALIAAPVLAAPALWLGARPVPAFDGATPAQPMGPFYPRTRPEDRDFDLVRFNGETAGGEVIEMAGQVLDAGGDPVPEAIVEIWHCDPGGRYAHVGDNNGGPADPTFQGYGAVRVGPDAGYQFRTVRPGVYPGRVRHIHAAVHVGGERPLVTQMYFPEERNGRDVLLRRVRGDEARAALVATRIDGPPPRYVFDIRLG